MKKLLPFIALAACSSEAPVEPTGPGLAIEVAPLTLPGITDASYSITVKNGLTQVVWTKTGLTSISHGNSQGALSYVGPCDASENPHSVELVLESLSAGGATLTSPGEYVNPTISATGVRTPIIKTGVICGANADTLVAFDLTVLRSANQGFFDVAVEFDDIFCSAKIDCKPSLMLKTDGTRGPAAIFAFACTAGPGDQTHLYLSDLKLTCTDAGGSTTSMFDLGAATEGNQGPRSGIFQWQTFRDEELVEQSGFDKCFWNTSLGLDTTALAGKSCQLTATGTAAGAALTADGNQYVLPGGGSYPVIQWDVEVLKPDGSLCTNNGLDVGGATGVTTEYATNAASTVGFAPLTAQYRCGEGVEEPEPQPIACSGNSQGTVTATPTENGFTLASTGLATANFELPPGYRLGSSCCSPECCQ